jgi:hypothetical protein
MIVKPRSIVIFIVGACFIAVLNHSSKSGAKPSIGNQVEVLAATNFKVGRTDDTLIVSDDNDSLRPVKLNVGLNMFLGMRKQVIVYPAGSPQLANTGGIGLESVLVHKPGTPLAKDSSSSTLYHWSPDGFPVPGTSYQVELKISIFETDHPPGHMWMPEGKKYKVLWETTLRKTVK